MVARAQGLKCVACHPDEKVAKATAAQDLLKALQKSPGRKLVRIVSAVVVPKNVHSLVLK